MAINRLEKYRMNKQRTLHTYILLGFIGFIFVLIGLDMLSTKFIEGIFFSNRESVSYTKLEQPSQGNGASSQNTEEVAASINTPHPSSTPRPSATPTMKSPTATFYPTNTFTPTPIGDEGWRACPGTYLSHLQVGDQAYVSFEPPLANRVRSKPYTTADVLGKIEPGEKVEIIKGPSCSNGWVWWKVSSLEQDLVGWTSEGDESDYWLIKIEN